jgi:hypothetical protein
MLSQNNTFDACTRRQVGISPGKSANHRPESSYSFELDGKPRRSRMMRAKVFYPLGKVANIAVIDEFDCA